MDNEAFVRRLKVIRKLNQTNKDYVNNQLYKLVMSRPALIAGYEGIKSNKGATTPSSDEQSLDGFGEARLVKLMDALKNESWQPRPARREMIPKPGKTTLRPLGIQGPEEKIVQSALLIVLENVYEPIFSEFSYGFRPNRNTHHALSDIATKYDGVPFAIEGDIKGMYDNVNHHILIDLISKKISDSRLIALIWKLLRSGYMLEGKYFDSINYVDEFKYSFVGTPQGSIVSPLLANIYLHELDIFMHSLVVSPEKRTKIRTPAAKEIRTQINQLARQVDKSPEGKGKELLVKSLKELKLRSISICSYIDPEHRIYYHRYADDFIIGIAAGKDFVEDVKKKVGEKLASIGLELSQEKTKVTSLKEDKALFLGYYVSLSTSKKVLKMHPKGKTPFLKGTTGSFVKLQAPMDRLIQKLKTKSFCNSDGFPTPKRLWSVLPDHEIVNMYNLTLSGLFNYYSGSSYRNRLRRLLYILKFSCAMTMASKHRSSVSKILSKHGNPMVVVYGDKGEKMMRFRQPETFKEKDIKWQLGKPPVDPFSPLGFKLTRSKILAFCCICGDSTRPVSLTAI